MTYIFQSDSLLTLIRKLFNHVDIRRRGQLVLLFCLMILSTIAEVISLGAVFPFLTILIAPEKLFNNPYFRLIAGSLGINSANQIILPLTFIFIIVAIIAATIRILLLGINSRLTSAIGSELSINVYRRILYQPYYVHLSRNSSQVINEITHKVNGVVNGVITPLLLLLNSILVFISLLLAVIYISPFIAVVSFLVFGISYGLLAWMSRKRLLRNSKFVAENQSQTIKVLQESLGGIRDIILDGSQLLYSDLFLKADRPLRRANIDNNFTSQYPRFVMEMIGIILIAILSYILSLRPGGIQAALPILAALGISSQRLLPALQSIYNSWVLITSNKNQLADTIEILNQSMPADLSSPPALSFSSQIQIKNVRFRYTNTTPWILDDINITIPKGTRVGFIGSTGTGKSTLLDVIMGLLTPSSGEIQIDGKTISGEGLKAWQRCIAHVPQSIYLADCSIAENIAFGAPNELTDIQKIKDAAKLAQISDFIESIPAGYNSMVGERGVQISGGQRQRIGIARALYKQAEVLVFDEATSALDNATELAVMDAVAGLNRNLTILIIAHRLTSLKGCDLIIELEKGKVIRQGSYNSIIESNMV
jgi:ATP-binding cassette subfamily B protein